MLAKQERDKQLADSRHPLHEHEPVPLRLRSRRSFMTVEGLVGTSPKSYKLRKWKEIDANNINDALPDIADTLPPGKELPRREWATLNRARAKTAKTNDNLARWGIKPSAECPCGVPTQTLEHLQQDCPLGPRVTDYDLKVANQAARD